VQETRLWDPAMGRSTSMRGKEEAHDYRYFPDPDLLPVVVDEDWLATIRDALPELPDARQQRLIDAYGLTAYDADRLTADRDLGDYFEACLAHAPQAKLAANWILGDLMAWLNAENRAIAQSPVSPEYLGQLLTLIDGGQISGKMAKTVFEEMVKTGQDPKAIVAAKGLEQVSDAGELEAVVAKVLAAAPDEVAAYRQGKKKLMGFFVGQVMRETRGQANPKLVNEILQRMLAA
jgi:aspartyl-tRNA(Asn)/glutamyl-tRNA(Gln) amidotransferase subunit B